LIPAFTPILRTRSQAAWGMMALPGMILSPFITGTKRGRCLCHLLSGKTRFVFTTIRRQLFRIRRNNSKMNRQMKIDSGLAFAIPLSDGTFGFGQIIAKQSPICYMVGLGIRRDRPELIEEELVMHQVVLAGNFFDVLIRNGRWLKLGKFSPIRDVPFPCYKVKIGDKYYIESWDMKSKREASPSEVSVLGNRSNHGPIILEKALLGHFGIAPWDPSCDAFAIANVEKVARMV